MLRPEGPGRGRAAAAWAVSATVILATVVVPTVPAAAETANVDILDLAFTPPMVRVAMVQGEPAFPESHAHVKWVNSDSGTDHTVTFDAPGQPSSGPLPTGQVYDGVFSAAGTFSYRCAIHPAMTGSVVVADAPPAGATTAPGVASGPTTVPSTQPGSARWTGPSRLLLVGIVVALAGGTGVAVARWRRGRS